MQKLTTRQSFNTMSRALRYLELRLARFPELAEFRDQVVAARKKHAEAHASYTEAQEQRIAATAEIGALDDGVDDTTLTLGQATLALFDRNREHPLYKRAFPQSPSSALTDVGGDRQERFVANLCATLKTDDAYAPLREKGLALERLAEQLKQAQARRQDLWQREAALGVKYEMTADAIRREYNALYHQFMLRMPGREAEIDTLFLQLNASGHKAPGKTEDPADGQ